MSETDRCAEAAKFKKIDAAFRAGDLEGLREAVEDPSAIPNGVLPLSIGNALVYAIYHSPLTFIRTLLDIGANPNPELFDGFPPIIAALSCSRPQLGSPGRPDVPAIIALLLSYGSDPNQRGINDYTTLHMAVAEQNLPSVQLLLDAGADRDLRTRIDGYETPLEMARRAGFAEFVKVLEQ